MASLSIIKGFLVQAGLTRLLMSGAVFTLSLATVATGFTGAIFTDEETVGGNLFQAGTVDISASPTGAAVSLSAMAPGDKVTGPLAVANEGSLQLRYTLSSVTTENTLAGQLEMTIKTNVTSCDGDGFDADGSTIYGPAALGSTGGVAIIENQVLDASASDGLCVQVALPLGTGNDYQGLSTEASFEFIAEQTANN